MHSCGRRPKTPVNTSERGRRDCVRSISAEWTHRREKSEPTPHEGGFGSAYKIEQAIISAGKSHSDGQRCSSHAKAVQVLASWIEVACKIVKYAVQFGDDKETY